MGETEDRQREARETDQSISDRQRQAVDDDREARRQRLAGNTQTPVGGNLTEEQAQDAQEDARSADS